MKIITDTVDIIPEYDLESIAPLKDMLFFDIETTGLKKETTQVYLIGCAFYEDGKWKIRQYLTQSALDEQEILEEFFDLTKNYKTLIHFNGDGFDIPYLQYKSDSYGLTTNLYDFKSFDIYKRVKPLKKFLGLSSLSQRSIEGFLKIEREDRLDGGLLIPYYFEYERTRDEGAEKLLLIHNYEDILGMLKIISVLNYSAIAEGGFSFRDYEEEQRTAIFEYRLDAKVPVEIEKHSDDESIVVWADKDRLQVNIKIFEGCAFLPVKDIENYYYLPDEDIIVHKDVADFVDRKHRKKATKSNCFLKKEGRFLPQKHELFTPSYTLKEDRKKNFFELTDDVLKDDKIMVEYALDIMGF